MEYQVKKFEELSTVEFYAIVKERIAVFVVEQQCPYQEVDDIDGQAWHTFFKILMGRSLPTREYMKKRRVSILDVSLFIRTTVKMV